MVQAGLALTLTGCDQPLSALEPAGPAAGSIATLWWVMLAVSTALFLLVMALWVLVIKRPGWGSNVSPTRWIVLGGLALPAIVLLPLIACALIAGERLLPLPGRTPMQIDAVARQWSWSFRYPDHGGVETNGVLHLPAGTPVDINVTSGDVIHAFWVPRLAGKIDALPGHVNRLRVRADTPGRYEGLCNEFCGLGHAKMRFTVIVHAPQDYSTALTQVRAATKAQR